MHAVALLYLIEHDYSLIQVLYHTAIDFEKYLSLLFYAVDEFVAELQVSVVLYRYTHSELDGLVLEYILLKTYNACTQLQISKVLQCQQCRVRLAGSGREFKQESLLVCSWSDAILYHCLIYLQVGRSICFKSHKIVQVVHLIREFIKHRALTKSNQIQIAIIYSVTSRV